MCTIIYPIKSNPKIQIFVTTILDKQFTIFSCNIDNNSYNNMIIIPVPIKSEYGIS